jgi:uncharacterized protein YjiK
MKLLQFFGVVLGPFVLLTAVIVTWADDQTNKLKLPPATFQALQFVSGRFPHELSVSVGEFTLAGPKEDSLKPLPERIRHLAYDAAQKRYYGITGHDVHVVDVENKTSEKLELPGHVPELSWPCGIAFDTRRQRLIVVSLGGVGHMYAYATKTKEWSVVAELDNLDLSSLTYDNDNDRLYALHRPHAGPAELVQFNGHGAVIKRIKLDAPELPADFGAAQRGPPVYMTMHDGQVVLVAEKSIFTVDLPNGKVLLTTKK